MAKNVEEWLEELRRKALGLAPTYHYCSNLYRLLEKIYFPKMRILDVGGGPGHFFRVLEKLGDIRYTVFDRDSKKIEIGKEVWKDDDRINLQAHDINESMGENLYDVVICYTVLVHLTEHTDAVRNLFKATKKHLVIRNKFGKAKVDNFIKAIDGYDYLYPFDGVIPYTTVSVADTLRTMYEIEDFKFVLMGDDSRDLCNATNYLIDYSKFNFTTVNNGWQILYVQKK